MTRVLIVGGSRGLGRGLVAAFAERGDHVLATCRAHVAALEALGVEVLDGFDVTDDAGMRALTEAIGDRPIDVLIYNAGINTTYAAGIETIDVSELRREFEVNTFGALRAIQAVLPALGEGSKIALISTWRPGVGAAGRNYGYQMSKTAVNQLGFLLADELAPRGIASVVLSPGPMDTDLLRAVVDAGHANLGSTQASDPLDVARDLRDRIDELQLEDSGSWRFRTGESMGDVATSRVFGH